MSTTPELPALPAKFVELETELNGLLVERRTEVNVAVTALASGSHVFLLGPPGIAKSMLVNEMAKRVGEAERFEILLDRFTGLDEVFGPVKLSSLREDKYERQTDGYLATANFAFLDEIWKCGPSLLNALLWILNERIYRHGTEVVDVPLGLMMCASNETPENNTLNALYDRLPFKLIVDDVQDSSNFIKVMNLDVPSTPETVLTWDEVLEAQQQVREVEVPDVVLGEMVKLRGQLKEEGIMPSTRRWRQSMNIIRAAAWLDGESIADTDHLRPLKHVLWEEEGQVDLVDSLVTKVASPIDAEAREVLIGLDEIEDQIKKLKSDEGRHQKGAEMNGKLRRVEKKLNGLKEQAGDSRRRNVLLDEITDRIIQLTDQVLVDLLGFSPEEAAKIDKTPSGS